MSCQHSTSVLCIFLHIFNFLHHQNPTQNHTFFTCLSSCGSFLTHWQFIISAESSSSHQVSTTMKEVAAKVVAYIVFVINLPDVNIESLSLDKRECCICREEYEDTLWQLGKEVHRHVLLTCGHALGMPCLARWAHSSYFSNHCPLCRGQLYLQPKPSIPQVESMLQAIYDVQNICSSHPQHIWCDEKAAFSVERKKVLHSELKKHGSELTVERTMVFLDAHLQDWQLTSRHKYQIIPLG